MKMELRQMPIRCNKREVCNLFRFDAIAQIKVLIFALKTPSKNHTFGRLLEGVFNAKISTCIWAIASKRNKLHTSRLLHRIGICLSFIFMCINVELLLNALIKLNPVKTRLFRLKRRKFWCIMNLILVYIYGHSSQIRICRVAIFDGPQ
eukprot:sb/3473611/